MLHWGCDYQGDGTNAVVRFTNAHVAALSASSKDCKRAQKQGLLCRPQTEHKDGCRKETGIAMGVSQNLGYLLGVPIIRQGL